MCQLTDKFVMKTHLAKAWHQTKPWGICGVLGCNICSIKLHSDAPIPQLFASALQRLKQLLTSPGHMSADTDPQRPNVSVNSPRHNQLKKVVKIHNPLTFWKKKPEQATLQCCLVRFALIYLLSIEFGIHSKYWICLWGPAVFCVMNLTW